MSARNSSHFFSHFSMMMEITSFAALVAEMVACVLDVMPLDWIIIR